MEVPAREVEVHRLSLVACPDDDKAVFEIECGKGTYVRALARDFGRDLGCFGHVSKLRRTCVVPFGEADMVPLADLVALEAEGDADAAPGCARRVPHRYRRGAGHPAAHRRQRRSGAAPAHGQPDHTARPRCARSPRTRPSPRPMAVSSPSAKSARASSVPSASLPASVRRRRRRPPSECTACGKWGRSSSSGTEQQRRWPPWGNGHAWHSCGGRSLSTLAERRMRMETMCPGRFDCWNACRHGGG